MNFWKIKWINKKSRDMKGQFETYELNIVANNIQEITHYIKKRLGHDQFVIVESMNTGEIHGISDEIIDSILLNNLKISEKMIQHKKNKEEKDKKEADLQHKRWQEQETYFDQVIGPFHHSDRSEKSELIKGVIDKFKKHN